MSKTNTFAALLLLTPALFAQSAFDGTWRMNYDKSTLSSKPLVLSLNKGIYTCSECSPQYEIEADGTEQPVAGQSFDIQSVRAVDPQTVALTYKKAGKPYGEQTMTVSDDGNTLKVTGTFHKEGSEEPVDVKATWTRAGKAPAGAHAISGSWIENKVEVSETGLTFTFKSNGDEVTHTNVLGATYTAKLDGKYYPVKGGGAWTSVSLKRIDDRTILETDKNGEKVAEIDKWTVSPDGKTMTLVATGKPSGRTSTLVAKKQ
jgi:hypothetical protein